MRRSPLTSIGDKHKTIYLSERILIKSLRHAHRTQRVLERVAAFQAESRQIQQAFAVLLPVHSVGVMGDGRTYEEAIAVRAVSTDDFMTADWFPMPHEVLGKISTRIINEVRGVNRVVYDISSKPPSTIEWE